MGILVMFNISLELLEFIFYSTVLIVVTIVSGLLVVEIARSILEYRLRRLRDMDVSLLTYIIRSEENKRAPRVQLLLVLLAALVLLFAYIHGFITLHLEGGI